VSIGRQILVLGKTPMGYSGKILKAAAILRSALQQMPKLLDTAHRPDIK
jgi:hypothetical protein